MPDECLSLIEPDPAWREAYLAMLDEFLAAGEDRWREVWERAASDLPGLIRQWRDIAQGRTAPTNGLVEQPFWLVRNGRDLLGTGYLRPRVSDDMRRRMGHIGGYVRPRERGKGYGTQMLAMMLEKARECGLRRVMLITRKDNAAAQRVITRCGGQLDSEFFSEMFRAQMNRYWIEL